MVSAPQSAAEDFTSRVLDVVAAIPAGRVMSYGDVAAVLGSRASRAVGHVMAHFGTELPWWRVIRASGHPPAHKDALALEHYRTEGTPLLWSASGDYRINLREARFTGE
jgi:alkylated DNA nucleotide flippase Atl1